MRFPLPILTGMVCSRCETHWCFWFGVYRITYPYQVRACDGEVIQVGLVLGTGGLPSLTILYRASDLALPRPQETFTNPPPPLEGTTHSDDTMCYVGL